MKILIVSFYYPPDLSAGSFRVGALVEALHRVMPDGLQVEVLTTMPNRYQSLAAVAPEVEDLGWLRIRRFKLPRHKSGMVDQAWSFLAFARQVWAEIGHGKWDVVFATTSRLLTGALGSAVAKHTKACFYLDIRDLFPETISDVLGNNPARIVLPILRGLEHRIVMRADRVNLVSPGFLPDMEVIAPHQDFKVFTNGIDDEFMNIHTDIEPAQYPSMPLVLYAGNIGEGQGLQNILPEVARQQIGKVRFRVIGDGGRRKQLEMAISSAGVSNVEILPPVKRADLITHYREADILFLHLNDHAAFRKVLPSKLFEYAAMDKPILAGVRGYAADFLRLEVPDAEVFLPCDAMAMSQAINRILASGTVADRRRFREKFSRRVILDQMAWDMLDLAINRTS